MEPAPGLFDISATTAHSRRRRLDPDRRSQPQPQPQPGDRLPTTSNTTTSCREHPASNSPRSKKTASAAMSFDPNIATRSWEVYQDPSTESLVSTAAQSATTKPAIAATTMSASEMPSHHRPSETDLLATTSPSPSTSFYSSRSSTPPAHTIVSVPNEASRLVADRMLRTLNIVLREERRRKRRLAAVANSDPGMETSVGGDGVARATDKEMVKKMEEKYRELTLLEEGEEINNLGERGDEQSRVDRQTGGEVMLEDRRRSQPDPRMDPYAPATVAMNAGQRIYGPDLTVHIPTEVETTSASTLTSTLLPPPAQTPGYISLSSTSSAAVVGTGGSFAERIRARVHERRRLRATGSDEGVEVARKKMRLAGEDGGALDTSAATGDGSETADLNTTIAVQDVSMSAGHGRGYAHETGVTPTFTAVATATDVEVLMHDPTDDHHMAHDQAQAQHDYEHEYVIHTAKRPRQDLQRHREHHDGADCDEEADA